MCRYKAILGPASCTRPAGKKLQLYAQGYSFDCFAFSVSVGIYIYICASALITCKIITLCTLLPCNLAWVDFSNLDALTDASCSY